MFRVRSMRACGPSTGPTACALAGRRCSLWGWRKGVPGWGAFHRVVRGAWCQALSLPRPPVLWSGRPGFRDPCVPGAVDAGVWTQHRPHSVRPCGPALLALGVAEGRPRVGCLLPCCEGRLVSGAVPPPTARPLERAAGVPRPVCPGCGRCGRVDPAPAPQRAPLRAGVARCGAGGRASPGGVPSTVVRGAWCQALSLPRPPVLWSGRPGFRDPCVPGAVDAGVWTQHRPHSVRPCGPALLAVGVAEGRPRVGCLLPCCEGRLVSGAVPPPTARPLERAAGVPRPVCPGCGRCGRVDPAPAPQRAPLRAGVARFGGGGRASPGGVPSTVVWGAWCQALSLPRPPVLWSGQPGFRDPCVPGAVDAGVWTLHRPHSMRPCGPALLAVGVAEGRPRGGVSSAVVRGAWCQALSLPRPPVLWSGQPGFRNPCVPGAADAGVWTLHRPHSVRPCGPALLAVGVAEGRPRGGVSSAVVRGAWCQALSLPRPPVLWSGQPGFRNPCVPGAADAGVWTLHRPHSVRPCGPALLAVGVAEGRPRGGVSSAVVRGAWCQALSLPRPPVLWSGQPGFRYPCVPGAVDAGVWTLHQPHSVRPCGPALLAVGVAEGHPRGGCLPPL